MFGKKRDETVSQSAPTYIGGSMKSDGNIGGRRPVGIDGEGAGTRNWESDVGGHALTRGGRGGVVAPSGSMVR